MPGGDTAVPLETHQSVKLQKRYGDAFRVAKTLNSWGSVFKILGIIALVVGVVLVFAKYFSDYSQGGDMSNSTNAALAEALGALGFSVSLYGLGLLISAVGQILLALLDNSINTSPFLTTPQKAEIIL